MTDINTEDLPIPIFHKCEQSSCDLYIKCPHSKPHHPIGHCNKLECLHNMTKNKARVFCTQA